MLLNVFKRILIICAFANLGYCITSCTAPSATLPLVNFDEMEDTAPSSGWEDVTDDLHVSFVSNDARYPKSTAPVIEHANTCILTGWKGEKVSAQLLVWSSQDLEQVTCTFGDFKSSAQSLPGSIAQARFVGYVMTDIFGEKGCGYRKPEDFPASLSADILHHPGTANIERKTVRPVWITVEIPRTVAAGAYNGVLTISSKHQEKKELALNLTVLERELPPSSEWAYHLDLWQHPSAVARVEGVELWSEEHFKALYPTMKMLADAGQKVITVNLNKDPWNNQCYDPYADMITWNKQADGTWNYDYSCFDKWVEFMLGLGVHKMINCYSILPWNNEVHYRDVVADSIVNVVAEPGAEIFYEVWTPFLKDFVRHLTEKGWLSMTNIAMDERSPESMEFTIELLGSAAPELGIALADNHKSYRKYPHIKDMCVAIEGRVADEDIEKRREMGLNTTYYVCCADAFPNMFTFSPPAESVYAAWYAAACGYDGFLRWAYNSWTEEPFRDSRFRTWAAGDTYMVYPGGVSSIRFERLIEGIQDFEKIRILREELGKQGAVEAIEKLNAIVSRFGTGFPEFDWELELRNAREALNAL